MLFRSHTAYAHIAACALAPTIVTRRLNLNSSAHACGATPTAIEIAKIIPLVFLEMIESYQGLWITHLTRDGSMAEVGDEGHCMSVICSPGDLYGDFVHKGAPVWFTPVLETIFLDSYRCTARFW